jgi:digeranylgeranylglycerophospholipid reductase
VTELDVAIVGAGPMGSFAARRMAAAGLSVALFEKDSFPGESTVCAGGMHADLIPFLELPESLIEKTLAFRMVLDARPIDWRFAERTYVTVERSRLDAFMAERAVQAGATLQCNARVVDVDLDAGVLTHESGGQKVQRHAKVFVFADGPRSLGHRVLGGAPRLRREFVGVEYDLVAPNNQFDALEVLPDAKLVPFGYAWIFPKKNVVNVGLARLGVFDGESLWKLLDGFIARRPDLRGLPIAGKKGGIIPAQIAPVLQRNNGLLIGDAAGMINPLTGGGYVCGFLSAAVAADAIVEAVRAGAARSLDRYTRRLERTHHYLAIAAAARVLDGFVRIHHLGFDTAYLKLLHAYFRAVHAAMRFLPVIK